MDQANTTPESVGSHEEFVHKELAELKAPEDAIGFVGMLVQKAEEMSQAMRARVERFVANIRGFLSGTKVGKLPEGVGGQYDGSAITLAATTLDPAEGGDAAVALRTKETVDHEKYHKAGRHTERVIKGASANGEFVVTIGGENFTLEELIEGLTVRQTNRDHLELVSDEYKGFVAKLDRAIAASSRKLSVEDVEEALNKRKDLRLIDDTEGGEERYAA